MDRNILTPILHLFVFRRLVFPSKRVERLTLSTLLKLSLVTGVVHPHTPLVHAFILIEHRVQHYPARRYTSMLAPYRFFRAFR